MGPHWKALHVPRVAQLEADEQGVQDVRKKVPVISRKVITRSAAVKFAFHLLRAKVGI